MEMANPQNWNDLHKVDMEFYFYFFISTELTQELDKFVSKETEDLHNENGEDAIQLLGSCGDEEIGNIAEKWAKAFTQVNTEVL